MPDTANIAIDDRPSHEPSRRDADPFMRGVRLGLPIFLGYVPVGAAFGVLAATLGFSVVQAVACSALALAGAGQFIALSVMQSGAGLLSVLAATTIINLRYVLFASTASTDLREYSPARQAWLAFTLTDETFAINVTDRRQGRATAQSMSGVGAIAWAGWVLGTLLGAWGAGWIGDPTRWGVQFAMPAMFTALLIALADDRRHVIAGIGAGAIALALPLAARVGIGIPDSWLVIIASVVTATVAAVVWRDV